MPNIDPCSANLSSSGASIQGLHTGKAGSSGAASLAVKMTPSGPDFYNRGGTAGQSQQPPQHVRTRSMSKTNGPSTSITSAIASASQSRRNIQIKMKRKKFGMDRPIIASHDF